jgi:hypothetical protein
MEKSDTDLDVESPEEVNRVLRAAADEYRDDNDELWLEIADILEEAADLIMEKL